MSFTTGLQLGPKIPTARGARNLGVESLWILGISDGRRHLVLNLGALLDPVASGSGHPKGFEGGIDLSYAMDDAEWMWVGKLGAVRFVSSDPHQLHLTGGLAWSPSDAMSLSAILLCGLTTGSDPYGALIGVSPSASFLGK